MGSVENTSIMLLKIHILILLIVSQYLRTLSTSGSSSMISAPKIVSSGLDTA